MITAYTGTFLFQLKFKKQTKIVFLFFIKYILFPLSLNQNLLSLSTSWTHFSRWTVIVVVCTSHHPRRTALRLLTGLESRRRCPRSLARTRTTRYATFASSMGQTLSARSHSINSFTRVDDRSVLMFV